MSSLVNELAMSCRLGRGMQAAYFAFTEGKCLIRMEYWPNNKYKVLVTIT